MWVVLGAFILFHPSPFKQHSLRCSVNIEFETATEAEHIKKVTTPNVVTGLHAAFY